MNDAEVSKPVSEQSYLTAIARLVTDENLPPFKLAKLR